MEYTEKQWQQCKEEVAKLRSELKAFNKSRVELKDPAEKEATKQKTREMATIGNENLVLEKNGSQEKIVLKFIFLMKSYSYFCTVI
jgi:hypothetical protein